MTKVEPCAARDVCYHKKVNRFIPILFFLGFGLYYYCLPPMYSSDFGAMLQPAHRIAEGQVPYRDFFTVYSPVSFYLLAGLFHILGENDHTVRIFLTVQGMALLVLLYLITKRATGTRWLSLIPSLYIGGAVYPEGAFYTPHWSSGVWGLLAVLILLPERQRSSGNSWGLSTQRAFFAGLLFGISFLTIQNRGPWLLMGMLFYILIFNRTQRLQCAGSAAVGFLCPLIVGAAAALHAGALKAAWEALVMWSLTHYRHMGGYPYYYYYELHGLMEFSSQLQWGMTPAYIFFIVLVRGFIGFQFLLWLPLGVLAAVRAKGFERRMSECLLTMGASFFLFGISRPDASHIGQADLLGMTIWLGGMKFLRGFPLRIKMVAITLAALMGFIGATKEMIASSYSPLYPTQRGIVRGDPETYSFYQFLNDAHPQSSDVYILIQSPQLYWLFSLENPLPYDAMFPGYHTMTQVEEAVGGLQRVCPKWIIIDRFFRYIAVTRQITWPKLDTELFFRNPVWPFLSSNYTLASTYGDLRVFHRKEGSCIK